jgi:hypothetical protein
MNFRTLMLAGAFAGLLAATAAADDAKPADTAASADTASAKAPHDDLGQKKYKERINIVARKPLRRDIGYIDSRDRTAWHDFTIWQGVRDERPIIARKALGFHEPRPHRPRAERVLLIGRGPLRGPAPAK